MLHIACQAILCHMELYATASIWYYFQKSKAFTLQSHAHAIYCESQGCKNDNFRMRNCETFLIFTQNIDCGYALEPPRSMFCSRNKKNNVNPVNTRCEGSYFVGVCTLLARPAYQQTTKRRSKICLESGLCDSGREKIVLAIFKPQ